LPASGFSGPLFSHAPHLRSGRRAC
jgi:hypothetical protein